MAAVYFKPSTDADLTAEDPLLDPSGEPSLIYQQLLEKSGVAYHKLDKEGRIIQVNQTELSMLGYDRHEMVGQPVWNFVRPDEREHVEAATLEKLKRGRCELGQPLGFTFVGKGGTLVPILVNDFLVKDSADCITGIVSLLKCVSIGQQIRDRLQEDPSMIDSLPVCVLRKNREGQFTYVNKRFCEELGITRAEILGKKDADFYDPELAKKYRDDDLKVFAGGKIFETIEKHARRKGGQSEIVDVQVLKTPVFRSDRNDVADSDNELKEVQAVFWDCNEPAAVLAALVRAKEQLYRSLISHVPLWIYRKDADLRFSYVSDRYCEHVNKSREEILGKTDYDIHPFELFKKYERDDKNILRTGEPFEEDEEHQVQGQKPIFVHVKKTALEDEKENIIGLQGVFWDVTETHRAHERLRDLLVEKDALLRQQESLLKEVHHRVKNNLARVASLLSLQSLQTYGDRAANWCSQNCINRIYSMALVHAELYRSDNLAHIDASKYFGKLLDSLFASYAPDQFRPTVDVEPIDLKVDTAITCGLILTELVSNAFKHAFPNDSPEAKIDIALKRIGAHQLLLSVADNGVGFPSSFHLPDAEKLGLKLVYQWATKELGGKIELVPSPGAKFRITFETQDPLKRGDDRDFADAEDSRR